MEDLGNENIKTSDRPLKSVYKSVSGERRCNQTRVLCPHHSSKFRPAFEDCKYLVSSDLCCHTLKIWVCLGQRWHGTNFEFNNIRITRRSGHIFTRVRSPPSQDSCSESWINHFPPESWSRGQTPHCMQSLHAFQEQYLQSPVSCLCLVLSSVRICWSLAWWNIHSETVLLWVAA